MKLKTCSYDIYFFPENLFVGKKKKIELFYSTLLTRVNNNKKKNIQYSFNQFIPMKTVTPLKRKRLLEVKEKEKKSLEGDWKPNNGRNFRV